MNAKNTLENPPNLNQSRRESRRAPITLIAAFAVAFLALSTKAANVLVNPGFESSPIFTSGSWSQHASETWSMGAATGWGAGTLIHTGSEALWMQGLYGNGQGGPQTSYAAQNFTCVPGNTYTADAWFSTWVYCATGVGGFGGNRDR